METLAISCNASACRFQAPQSLVDSAAVAFADPVNPGWTEVPELKTGLPEDVQLNVDLSCGQGFDALFVTESLPPNTNDEDVSVPIHYEVSCDGANCKTVSPLLGKPLDGDLQVSKAVFGQILAEPHLIRSAHLCVNGKPTDEQMQAVCSVLSPLWHHIAEQADAAGVPPTDGAVENSDSTFEAATFFAEDKKTAIWLAAILPPFIGIPLAIKHTKGPKNMKPAAMKTKRSSDDAVPVVQVAHEGADNGQLLANGNPTTFVVVTASQPASSA